MNVTYEQDIVVWANEQAALLKAGKFEQLDIQHIVEEIEDVGKSEQRELRHRMAILLMHLLKWHYQPERRCRSWQNTIKTQRKLIRLHLADVPSLKTRLTDENWLDWVWTEAIDEAAKETGLDSTLFAASWLWTVEQVLSEQFLPDHQYN